MQTETVGNIMGGLGLGMEDAEEIAMEEEAVEDTEARKVVDLSQDTENSDESWIEPSLDESEEDPEADSFIKSVVTITRRYKH